MDVVTDALIKLLITLAPIVISVLAFLNSRRSRIVAERSLQLADGAKRMAEIEYLKTIPSIDIVGVTEVLGKHRVRLLISNMRSVPFRINSLKVSRRKLKSRTIKNYIISKIDPDFDWDFEKVMGIVWNPKGTLDNQEHYVHEACEFLVVKDREYVLVTIPEFDEYETYSFECHTTHGITTVTGSVSKSNRTLFCTEFRQNFVKNH